MHCDSLPWVGEAGLVMLVVAVYSKALQIYNNILIVLVPARLEG